MIFPCEECLRNEQNSNDYADLIGCSTSEKRAAQGLTIRGEANCPRNIAAESSGITVVAASLPPLMEAIVLRYGTPTPLAVIGKGTTPCNAAIFSTPRGPENGFAPQSLFRLTNIMLFILQYSNNIGIETMQTLLYNIDYCSLRKRGMALTGLCIPKCDSTGTGNQMELLSVLRDEISWQPSTEDNPAVIVLKPNVTSDMSIFNEDEMAVINCALTNPDRKLPIGVPRKHRLECHENTD